MADAVIEARQGEAEAPVFEGEDVAEEAARHNQNYTEGF